MKSGLNELFIWTLKSDFISVTGISEKSPGYGRMLWRFSLLLEYPFDKGIHQCNKDSGNNSGKNSVDFKIVD